MLFYIGVVFDLCFQYPLSTADQTYQQPNRDCSAAKWEMIRILVVDCCCNLITYRHTTWVCMYVYEYAKGSIVFEFLIYIFLWNGGRCVFRSHPLRNFVGSLFPTGEIQLGVLGLPFVTLMVMPNKC
jgi:hypothetical protein